MISTELPQICKRNASKDRYDIESPILLPTAQCRRYFYIPDKSRLEGLRSNVEQKGVRFLFNCMSDFIRTIASQCQICHIAPSLYTSYIKLLLKIFDVFSVF